MDQEASKRWIFAILLTCPDYLLEVSGEYFIFWDSWNTGLQFNGWISRLRSFFFSRFYSAQMIMVTFHLLVSSKQCHQPGMILLSPYNIFEAPVREQLHPELQNLARQSGKPLWWLIRPQQLSQEAWLTGFAQTFAHKKPCNPFLFWVFICDSRRLDALEPGSTLGIVMAHQVSGLFLDVSFRPLVWAVCSCHLSVLMSWC